MAQEKTRLLGIEKLCVAISLALSNIFPLKNKSFNKFFFFSCKYIEVKGTIHEDLADDIMGYAKKKFFNDASGFQYTDIWRFKSKLVAGNEDPEGL